MELKYIMGLHGLKNKPCSNCTFMELKYEIIKFSVFLGPFKLYLYGIEMKDIRATIESPDSSNCTFMELK